MPDDRILTENLAELAHAQWSGWMRYLFGCGQFDDEGNFVIRAQSAKRWIRQMNTSYIDLPESEKESDRKEAQRMINVFKGSED